VWEPVNACRPDTVLVSGHSPILSTYRDQRSPPAGIQPSLGSDSLIKAVRSTRPRLVLYGTIPVQVLQNSYLVQSCIRTRGFTEVGDLTELVDLLPTFSTTRRCDTKLQLGLETFSSDYYSPATTILQRLLFSSACHSPAPTILQRL
jgi:hypothetical protein